MVILDRRENFCVYAYYFFLNCFKSKIVEEGNVVLLNQYIFLWPGRRQCMFFNKTTHVFKDILDLKLISSVIVHTFVVEQTKTWRWVQ
jgi:hypothetical protein